VLRDGARSLHLHKKIPQSEKEQDAHHRSLHGERRWICCLAAAILGRAKQPYCFKKQTGEELGFSYRSNKKAWMTGLFFREWLLNLDREMRSPGRHILLLLDNASSHKPGDIVCTNVQVEFLPPNTTAFLQPMDAGIIAVLTVGSNYCGYTTRSSAARS
jgi:hypothetical protein